MRERAASAGHGVARVRELLLQRPGVAQLKKISFRKGAAAYLRLLKKKSKEVGPSRRRLYPCEAMGTRRWVGELESWLRRSGLSKDELVKRSDTSAATMRSLFEQPDPNPTLRVYLELVQKAGARFNGVINNDPVEIIKRLKEIMARENITTLSALAKPPPSLGS